MWRKALTHCVFVRSAKTVNPMERRSRMYQMAGDGHVVSVMKLEGHTMGLKYDMEHGVAAGRDNFHCLLIRLMMKADPGYYARLAKAFPNTAVVYEAWQRSEVVPDLEYEGDGDDADWW